ncbi:hypothetical protein [Metabacillus malikii]|uniref:Uncharacterized protein n=1 Tax=Metabacillus malikii TaxID=1504265 RepID=A0ABT9ZB14_9BACI|nr:hypothetical protein [Metabacillus malikii]MDQ0228798.1 hypothetical protein [Metabacillus malikii]
MARGKHFNHKQKGHTPTIKQRGKEVPRKVEEYVEYAIEPVATENKLPVSFKVEKK